MAEYRWDYRQGRDAEGEKFCHYLYIDIATNRIVAYINAPSIPDGYAYRAWFERLMPKIMLDIDSQVFAFTDVESAKKFVVQEIGIVEAFDKKIKEEIEEAKKVDSLEKIMECW